MEGISKAIQQAIRPYRYQARTVAISHLAEVQDAVGQLIGQGLIDKRLSEKWRFYKEPNKDLPAAKTIIIAAMPQPITRFNFTRRGNTYHADIPPTYLTEPDQTRILKILQETLEPYDYAISKAHLPLKTLVVRSGLAKYGKNNLAYVPGAGSFCRLTAFYTHAPCEEDNWVEPKVMEACRECTLCRENCKNNCITAERFLIHAEKCLTRFNEEEVEFPGWVQSEWHNSLVGCLRCQLVCPMNKPFISKIAVGPDFSEAETESILNKTPVEQLAHETKQKLDSLIHEEIYPVMARNLKVLIEQQKMRK